jgi:hypothetical protein
VNTDSTIVNTIPIRQQKVFTIASESLFTIDWNHCSRSIGIGVHDGSEYAAIGGTGSQNAGKSFLEAGVFGCSLQLFVLGLRRYLRWRKINRTKTPGNSLSFVKIPSPLKTLTLGSTVGRLLHHDRGTVSVGFISEIRA